MCGAPVGCRNVGRSIPGFMSGSPGIASRCIGGNGEGRAPTVFMSGSPVVASLCGGGGDGSGSKSIVDAV